MIIKLERIRIQTRKSEEVIDITPRVEEAVEKSGIKNGLVNVLTSHTSSGVLVTEGIPCLEGHSDPLLPPLPRRRELPSPALSRL